MDHSSAGLVMLDRKEATRTMATALIDRFGRTDARKIAGCQAGSAIGDARVSWLMIGDVIGTL